jgi:hypothetical protein
MGAYVHSSIGRSRLWLFAVILGVLVMMVAAAPVSGASLDPGTGSPVPGVMGQELVIADSEVLVDPSSATINGSSALSDEAIAFAEQNFFVGSSSARVGTSRQRYHYLDENLDISSPQPVGITRERYHYLDEELAIAAPASVETATRYDHHQFLSDDYVDNFSSPAVSSNVTGNDHNQFLSGDYMDNYPATKPRARRYDEIQFLEENEGPGPGNSEFSDRSVRLHHDSYPAPRAAVPEDNLGSIRDRIKFLEDNWLNSPDAAASGATSAESEHDRIKFLEDNWLNSPDAAPSGAMYVESERDRIQFLEDNWYFAESKRSLPALVNEHLAR